MKLFLHLFYPRKLHRWQTWPQPHPAAKVSRRVCLPGSKWAAWTTCWRRLCQFTDVATFPPWRSVLKDIVQMVRNRLELRGIMVKDVRLNGSTASHVLEKDIGWSYKDLDVIFRVDLPREKWVPAHQRCGFWALCWTFCQRGWNKEKISPMTLKEAYVQKLVKVYTEQDRWSLISLSNNNGRNVELKFVDSIRRTVWIQRGLLPDHFGLCAVILWLLRKPHVSALPPFCGRGERVRRLCRGSGPPQEQAHRHQTAGGDPRRWFAQILQPPSEGL